MYIKNKTLLEEKVKNRAFIRNVRFHRNVAGSIDREGNLRLWNEVMSDFHKIFLNDYVNSYEKLDSLQEAPYIVFIPGQKSKATIVVAHGGGFYTRTGCEAGNVAYAFNLMGYNVAILSYRLSPYSRFDSLEDMQAAIFYLRDNAKTLEIGEKIVVMGFSAGAMLAANAATLWSDYKTRPDAAIISYGAMSVVSYPMGFMHEADNMEKMLYGRTIEERYRLAPEKHVDCNTPPMFIWQTLSDDGRYGMTLAKALADAAVSYELHIFDGGVHGVALADGENDLDLKDDHVNHWVEMADEWLKGKVE